MTLERCDKAPMGLECIDKLGHAGKCSCIKTEAFNAAMQAAEDDFLWGGFKIVPNPQMPDGVIGIFNGKTAPQVLEIVEPLRPLRAIDPADELGKVWDVLHAAGINGAGGISASEGVKALADKLLRTKELLNANYGKAAPTCDACQGTGWVQPDVAIEVCKCIRSEV